MHNLCVIFLHFLPAYFIDFLLFIFRQKRLWVHCVVEERQRWRPDHHLCNFYMDSHLHDCKLHIEAESLRSW
jgi:hypothetical protein